MAERRPVEPPLLPRNNNELIVEDVDGNEYRLLDPSRLSFRRSQADSNSLLRVPSRASDSHQQQRNQRPVENPPEGSVARPPTRDEEFIRDGNAEILRLVTRGRENDDDEEPMINQPERPYTHEDEGKEVIMKKFIEDSTGQTDDKKVIDEPEENERLLKRAMTMREQDLTTADINRLTTIQRDLLLTRFLVEENRRTRNNSVGDETQSLPGVVTMATQTDSHAETQTEKTYFAKRRTKSDNDDSDSEENGRRRFKRNVRNRMLVDSAVEAFQMRPKEIKTPIMEEPEADGIAVSIKNGAFTETKASLLRHAATRNKLGLEEIDKTDGSFKVRSMSDQDLSVVNKHREEVVRSLQVTPVKRMNITKNVLVEHVTHEELGSPNLSQSLPNRRARVASVPSKQLNKQPMKRQASSEPVRSRQSSKDSSSLEREAAPRYMEWYNKKRDKENTEKKPEAPRGSTLQRRKPVLKQQKTKRPTYPKPVVDVDEEIIVPNLKASDAQLSDSLVQTEEQLMSRDSRREEDGDSGIAVYMNGPHIGSLRHQSAMEKKSIFTIAYDDMETRKIRLDTASP